MKLVTNGHTKSFHLKVSHHLENAIGAFIFLCLFLSCNNTGNTPHQEIVTTPEQMNERVPDIIRNIVNHFADNAGKIDSIFILQPTVLQYTYGKGFSYTTSSDEALRTELNKLRNGLSNALVTTY